MKSPPLHDLGVHVRYEATADADVMRVTVDEPFCDGPKQVMVPGEAATPLVAALMGIPGIMELFFLDGTLTIQKEGASAWQDIMPTVQSCLEAHPLAA